MRKINEFLLELNVDLFQETSHCDGTDSLMSAKRKMIQFRIKCV